MEDKEKCPRCGGRGFYAGIGIYWVFRCDNCGYKDGNTPEILKKKGDES